MSAADPAGAVRLRRAGERFPSRAGGIASLDAFSRGDAFDPAWMGWGVLRVLSHQDWAPGAARDEGRVANMQRLLLVLEGALVAECDALGRHRAGVGEALWLHCGHGMHVRLANASGTEPLRLLEAWWQPDRVNAPPSATVLPCGDVLPGQGGWRALDAANADPDAARRLPGQGVQVALGRTGAAGTLALPIAPAGKASRYWLEVLEGEVTIEGHGHFGPGDGLAWRPVAAAPPECVAASGPARLLRFALPD